MSENTQSVESARVEPTSDWGRGSWMQTYTGRQFYPLDARPEDILPEDIAHALSMICRYGGHVRQFYSVAEHCLLMSHAVAPEHALWALLHDATEAYVGDMVRPLKHHMPEYREVENRLMVVIGKRFGIDGTSMPDAVKEADNRILLDEWAALLTAPPVAWEQDGLKPLGVKIGPLPWYVARKQYADRLTFLLTERRLSPGNSDADCPKCGRFICDDRATCEGLR